MQHNTAHETGPPGLRSGRTSRLGQRPDCGASIAIARGCCVHGRATYRPGRLDKQTVLLTPTIPSPPARCTIAPSRASPVEIAAQLVCVVGMRRFLAALSICLWACGDNRPPPPDAAMPEGPFQPAPHAPLPIVFPH